MDQKDNNKRVMPNIHKQIVCSERGLTLVEIMTVLVILSLLAIFAAPEIINWRPGMNLKTASEDLLSNMHMAKIHAIKNNSDVVFTFTPPAGCPGGTYSFIDTAGTIVASVDLADVATPEYKDTCLASTYGAGQGFSTRGLRLLPSLAAQTVTITHQDLSASGDPTYTVTLTPAGGIQLDKVAVP